MSRHLTASALLSICLISLHIQPAQAVIYGADDRRDIFQVPQYSNIARATAVAVGNILLDKNADGTYNVEDAEIVGESFLCKDERFANQPSVGVCSGFLVGDRYLVTAGHCVLPNGIVDNQYHPFCDSFAWYFNYTMKGPNDNPSKNIPADRIYRCKNIIRAENIDAVNPADAGNDFAVIELDRPVTADIKPLPLQTRPVAVGDRVYTIGFPIGLPAKFSGMAPVRSIARPTYYEVNLDTQSGNSGGVVLNARNEVTGILISGFPEDFYNTAQQCQRFNHCDENGLNCVVNSKLQPSNFVQKIENVLPYIPGAAPKVAIAK